MSRNSFADALKQTQSEFDDLEDFRTTLAEEYDPDITFEAVIPNEPVSRTTSSRMSVKSVAAPMIAQTILNTGMTPFVHPTNVIAALCAKKSIAAGEAAKLVYAGVGDNPKNNWQNFYRGLAGHFTKDFVRVPTKSFSMIHVKPQIDSFFTAKQIDKDTGKEIDVVNANAAAIAFAAWMSCIEMSITNPADAWKAQRSVGQSFSLKKASDGALGNGTRQFGVWFGFSKSTAYLKPILQEKGIDPNSLLGLTLLSIGQTIAYTSLAYGPEIVLRKAQLDTERYKPKNALEVLKSWSEFLKGNGEMPKSVYASVMRDIVKGDGLTGFTRGIVPKFAGNLWVSAAANVLLYTTNQITKAWEKLEGKGQDISRKG